MWGQNGLFASFTDYAGDDLGREISAFARDLASAASVRRSSYDLLEIDGPYDLALHKLLVEERHNTWMLVTQRFHQRLATVPDLTPKAVTHLKFVFNFAAAAFAGAIDAAYHELRLQEFRATPYIRPHSTDWITLRPLSLGKKEEEVMNWNLALQIFMASWAQREGIVLFLGVPYKRIPGNIHAIEVCEMRLTDAMKEPISLPDLIRRDLLRDDLDPEMMRAARSQPIFIEQACDAYLKFNMPEMPHVIPSDRLFSFENGVLQVANTQGEPEIKFWRPGQLSDTTVCRAHHRYPFNERFVDKPLMPQLDFLDDIRRNMTRDGASPAVIDHALDSAFLEWMVREPTDDERVFMKSDQAHTDTAYLTSDISVCYKVWAAQDFSAQTIISLAAMCGRDFHDRSTDNWQVSKLVHGASRAGKNLTISDPIEQALGSDSVGEINAEKLDLFALAGAEEWRLLHVSEVRRNSQLPEAALLRMIAGEAVLVRKMGVAQKKLKRCHFHVMFSSNEDKLPVRSANGEFVHRIYPIHFRNSFAHCIDTTLGATRRAEIGAFMAFCARAYKLVRSALGRSTITQYLPFDMREETNAAKWSHNLIYEFLVSGDVVIEGGRPNRTARARIKDFTESPAARRYSDTIPVMELGVAFRIWLSITHTSSRMAWSPDNYIPVFKELGLPFHTEGIGGQVYPELIMENQVDLSSSGAVYPHASMVHYVKLSDDLSRRIRERVSDQSNIRGGWERDGEGGRGNRRSNDNAYEDERRDENDRFGNGHNKRGRFGK
jgi:hypothetical protein